jgi:hypothetical protein
MNKLRIALIVVFLISVASSAAFGSGSASTRSVTISDIGDGDGMVVEVSKALALSVFEGVVGSEIECGADLDDEFAGLLRELGRGGRRSRAVLRSDDGVLTAHRKGRSLKLDFEDADDGGSLEVKMPWAVAECLLDGSSSLSAKDAGSIKIKITGADGGSFEFKVD